MEMSLYEQLGGESKLRAIIAEFVRRVQGDLLIGFFFAQTDCARLEAQEFAYAAASLGGPVAYSGRDLGEVHRRLPILGGHFDRRRQLLAETLDVFAVPAAPRAAWLAHVMALRPIVLGPGAG